MKNTKGSITLETAVVLPIFFLFFMFIIGLLPLVKAQNQINHALIQAAKSLSFDTYLNAKVSTIDMNTDKLNELNIISGEVGKDEFIEDANNVKESIESITFYKNVDDIVLDVFRRGEKLVDKNNKLFAAVGMINNKAAKNRFIGYFAGSEENAQNVAKALAIKDGIDGIKIKAKVTETDVILTAEYVLKYWFDVFDAGEIKMNQSITSRLWKNN